MSVKLAYDLVATPLDLFSIAGRDPRRAGTAEHAHAVLVVPQPQAVDRQAHDGGEHRIERAVALAVGRWIMPGDLFPERMDHPAAENRFLESLGTARESAEKRHIQRALEMTGGAILPAAKALGISRTTLWEKMKRYGLAGVDA